MKTECFSIEMTMLNISSFTATNINFQSDNNEQLMFCLIFLVEQNITERSDLIPANTLVLSFIFGISKNYNINLGTIALT